MYVSKYYTNEEIDQRLLQGYFDDFVIREKDTTYLKMTSRINSKRNWKALKKEQTTSLSFLSWRMILSSKLKNR